MNIFEQALAAFPIRRQNPGGMDTHQHLTRLWFWARDLLKAELFRPAVTVNLDSLNGRF
jgi:hypothetical protein